MVHLPQTKILLLDPELQGCAIFGPKMDPFAQTKTFFRKKPVDKPSTYHSCLSAFQKSKSDINLLMKF